MSTTAEDIRAYGPQDCKMVGVRATPGSLGVSSDDPRLGDLGFVLDQIRAAESMVKSLMREVRPEEKPNVENHIGRLKGAYEALSNLETFLPLIEAWGVLRGVKLGTKDGEPYYSWTIWEGHTTEGQAKAFCEAWDEKDNKLSQKMEWSIDKWVVERVFVNATQIVNPNVNAQEYVAASGAFERR